MADPWIRNEHGVWCPSCGELISDRAEDCEAAGDCPTCGFPDDAELMAQFQCGEEEVHG